MKQITWQHGLSLSNPQYRKNGLQRERFTGYQYAGYHFGYHRMGIKSLGLCITESDSTTSFL